MRCAQGRGQHDVPEGAPLTDPLMRPCKPSGVTARVSASAVVTTDLSFTLTCTMAGVLEVRRCKPHSLQDFCQRLQLQHLTCPQPRPADIFCRESLQGLSTVLRMQTRRLGRR